MIFRTGALVVLVSVVGASIGTAQQRRVLGPEASVLFTPASSPPPDSVRVHPSYWKEGAVIGGVVGGVLGGLIVDALCDINEEPGGGTACGLLPTLGGVVIGAAIVAIPGALIGGQIPKGE